MKLLFFILFSSLFVFSYYKGIFIPLVNQKQQVIYPNMIYNLSWFTIWVFTNYNNYKNQWLNKNHIYFYWNEKFKNDYNWVKIDDLNVSDYNTLVKYPYKYFLNNLTYYKN